MTNVFDSGFDDDLHDICVVVSVLPEEYSKRILGIEELEDYFEKTEEFEEEALVLVSCMPRSSIIPRPKPQAWNSVIFEAPYDCMKTHLKPLFTQINIDGTIPVNKVLIDGGATITLMPEGVIERLRKLMGT